MESKWAKYAVNCCHMHTLVGPDSV